MTTMTEATGHPAQPVSPQRSGGEASAATRLTFARVVRSEWIKLRSLRSTWMTLAGVLGVLVGFGLLAATVADSAASGGPAARTRTRTTRSARCSPAPTSPSWWSASWARSSGRGSSPPA